MRGSSRRGRLEVPLLLCSICKVPKPSHATPGCRKCKFPGGVPLLDSPGPPPRLGGAGLCLLCSAHGCLKTPALPEAFLYFPGWQSPRPEESPILFYFHLFHCCSPRLPTLCRAWHRMASGNFGGINSLSASPSHVAGRVAAALRAAQKNPSSPPWVDLS